MIDIIELAEKICGSTSFGSGRVYRTFDDEQIERFAALYKQALIDSGELVELGTMDAGMFVKLWGLACEKLTIEQRLEILDRARSAK